MVQPPLAGQRASSVTGPSLQAIRERVGGSTIGRLTAPSPPQITVTTDGQQTTDIRLDQKGYLSGQESLPATSIDKDEDWARQLKDQDLPLQHVWSVAKPTRSPGSRLTDSSIRTGPGRTRRRCHLTPRARPARTARLSSRSESCARFVLSLPTFLSSAPILADNSWLISQATPSLTGPGLGQTRQPHSTAVVAGKGGQLQPLPGRH